MPETKYMMPRAESYLEVVLKNIQYNFSNGESAVVNQSPILQRAHTIVNETRPLAYTEAPREIE
jgi:hypothetical protein